MGDPISAIFAIGSGGSSAIGAYQAAENSRLQKRALEEQKKASALAQAASVAQQKRVEDAQAKANRKSPSIAALLLDAQQAKTSGTVLSGARGVKPLAGDSTLLGD